MQVELTRFRVRKGQEERAVEWMRFLRQNMDAVEQTLVPEKMYVETIFRRFVMAYVLVLVQRTGSGSTTR